MSTYAAVLFYIVTTVRKTITESYQSVIANFSSLFTNSIPCFQKSICKLSVVTTEIGDDLTPEHQNILTIYISLQRTWDPFWAYLEVEISLCRINFTIIFKVWHNIIKKPTTNIVLQYISLLVPIYLFIHQ